MAIPKDLLRENIGILTKKELTIVPLAETNYFALPQNLQAVAVGQVFLNKKTKTASFIKKILLNPQYSLQQYRDIIRPAIAGATILMTVMFIFVYIGWIPEIGVNRQEANKIAAENTKKTDTVDTVSLESPSPTIEATTNPTDEPKET